MFGTKMNAKGTDKLKDLIESEFRAQFNPKEKILGNTLSSKFF